MARILEIIGRETKAGKTNEGRQMKKEEGSLGGSGSDFEISNPTFEK